MSRDIDGIIKQKYAESGDVGLGGLSLTELWPVSYSTPGGPFPQRIQFNQLFRYLSALGVEINGKGPFLDYDGTVSISPDYNIGSIVKGSDNILYNCQVANGPASTIVNPVGDLTGTWARHISLDSHISGGIILNAADANHDITIQPCITPDSLNAEIIQLKANITKQIDAAWSVGDNAGGFFTGSVAADTAYPVYLIKKDSDKTIDAGIGSIGSIPAGYTAYERVGWVVTDASANIIGFQASEIAGGSVDISYNAAQSDLNTTVGITRQLLTPTAPQETMVKLSIEAAYIADNASVWVSDTYFTDVSPSSAGRDIFTTTNAQENNIVKNVLVDDNQRISYRSSASTDLRIKTQGFIDRRVD